MAPRFLRTLAWLSLGACAQGRAPASPDAEEIRRADAMPAADAAPTMRTLSQTTSDAIVPANAVACVQNATGFTLENSYYRAFSLTAEGIAGPFETASVRFGVQDAVATDGSQDVTVRLHRYTGTVGANLTVAAMTELASTVVAVPDQSSTFVTAPLVTTVPAGSTLVVEILSPDGTAAGDSFFIGSNQAGETGDGYVRGPGCNLTNPTAFDTLALPEGDPTLIDILISVTGT